MATVGHIRDDNDPEVATTCHTVSALNFSKKWTKRASMAKKQRTDAERRLRQCERLSHLLRTLHLIMGKGRWDADGLAEELECSRRTVYRLLQTLSMAGVPWFFDKTCRAYRVRPGFRFPEIEMPQRPSGGDASRFPNDLKPMLDQLIQEGQAFAATLDNFLKALQQSAFSDS